MTCSKPENKSHFFAHLSRLSLINRWPLMRTVRSENVSEHSLQVAFVAHALGIIQNRLFEANFNAERIALLAMYHDVSEVLTGDMATPVKYHNPQITREYKQIEKSAQKKLIAMLPAALQKDFRFISDDCDCSKSDDCSCNKEEKLIVKQADTLCAYLKCLEELAAHNNEFICAEKRLRDVLEKYGNPAVDYFMKVFVPSFKLSLHEISDDSPAI